MAFSLASSHLKKYQASSLDDPKHRAQHVARMPWAVVKNGKLLGVWSTDEGAQRFADIVGGQVAMRRGLVLKPAT